MDPTAQTNNPNPQEPQKSPIEPGQFVVAGEDPQVSQQPFLQSQTLPASAPPPPPPQPKAGFSLAQDKTLAQSYPAAPPPPPPQPSAPEQPIAPMQPDPTPFNGPGQTPFSQTAPASPPPGSKMKKIKLITILVSVIVLVGIIAAVAWFFVLKKQIPQTASVQNTDQSLPVPSSSPQAPSSGGFSQLPQATDGADASAGAQPSFPPPIP